MAVKRQLGFNRFQRWITVSCLVLVLLFTVVEAVHTHSDIARHSGAPCLICISAHSNAPALTAHFLPVLIAVASIIVPYEFEAKGIASRLELFTRPPPLA